MTPSLYATLRERIVKHIPEKAGHDCDKEHPSADIYHYPPELGLVDALRAMRVSTSTKYSVIEERLLGDWDLRLPLHLQEDSVGQFLLTVIE